MKISIITQGLGIKSGGPSRSVLALAEGLRNEGISLDILTTNQISNPNIKEADWIKCVYGKKTGPFGYISGIAKLLKSSKSNLFHIQGMFSYVPVIAPHIARSLHIPYIIAPRGMMYANALKKSALKKKIFRKLFIDRDLNNAACLHATCHEELEELRNAGITAPVAIIPNSIALPSELPAIAISEKFRIGFVGRINEIKNIDGLIRAWHIAGFGKKTNAELLIIGGTNLDSEIKYAESLHLLEKELGIANIVWAGMKTGQEKDDLLRSCTIAILPSHSENFGMVVPEALINGIPVIASDKTPWKMLEQYGCGWSTPNTPEAMSSIIKIASSLSEKELIEMGIKGQKMVVENFSTEYVTSKLIRLYEWINNGCKEEDRPEFVV